jgi:hypothetical protein
MARTRSRRTHHYAVMSCMQQGVLQAAFSVGLLHACCYTTVRLTQLCSSESTHNNRGSGVFCGPAPRPYTEDLTQLELELNWVPDLAVAAGELNQVLEFQVSS